MTSGSSIRIFWMLGSAIAHVLLSYWFNFLWCNTAPNAIDGGPLGFLTWTMVCDHWPSTILLRDLAFRSTLGEAGCIPSSLARVRNQQEKAGQVRLELSKKEASMIT